MLPIFTIFGWQMFNRPTGMLRITKLRQFLLQAVAIQLLLLLLATAHAGAAAKHGSKSLPANRWREIRRMDADSVAVPFLDTMFITIQRKDSFSYHNKDAFVYRGIYILDGKDLDFGYAKFKIVVKKPNSLELHDAKGYYVFSLDSTDTLKTIVVPREDKIDSNITIDKMIGHWTAYKRTALKALAGVDHNVLVKSLLITGTSTNGRLGFVFSDADKRDDPSWYMVKLDKDLNLNCEGRTKRTFKVDKCQNGELILEDEDMKYYFKQFK